MTALTAATITLDSPILDPVRPDPRDVLPRPEVRRLASGMELCILPWRRAPVVAAALVYRAGSLDEVPRHGGTAHFLEHMMFKGSRRWGPGELDRLTRSLGGSNNAYTTQDATLYYFTFAADRWQIALDIELDRMESLRLDPEHVSSEREVILEELAMYEGEPWDALDQAGQAAFFGSEHPYGRPILGDRDTLARIDRDVLGGFHREFYRPSNAVLAIVGDVDPDRAAAEAEERFGRIERGERPARPMPRPVRPGDLLRLDRRQGDMARLLLSLPSPAGDDPDHPVLRLLLTVLASGRSSRLHRVLVDDGELCVWASADVQETLGESCLQVACEVLPGVEPARVETEVLAALDALRREPPGREEIDRARQIVVADWISGHEKVDQLAFLFASSQALWDVDHPWRYLEGLLAATPEDLLRVADTYLDPAAGSVIAWSLPRNGPASS